MRGGGPPDTEARGAAVRVRPVAAGAGQQALGAVAGVGGGAPCQAGADRLHRRQGRAVAAQAVRGVQLVAARARDQAAQVWAQRLMDTLRWGWTHREYEYEKFIAY